MRNEIAQKECMVPWNKNLAFMMSFVLALTTHPPYANTEQVVTFLSYLLVVILSVSPILACRGEGVEAISEDSKSMFFLTCSYSLSGRVKC